MAKDPAFLFYPGDYLRDTQCLSEPAQVAYDRLMCEHMRNIIISKQRLNFFIKRLSEDDKEMLMSILQNNSTGYYIEWVKLSIEKRRAYSESRRQNRQSKGGKDMKTYESHMENENVNENVNKKETNNWSFESHKIPWSFRQKLINKYGIYDSGLMVYRAIAAGAANLTKWIQAGIKARYAFEACKDEFDNPGLVKIWLSKNWLGEKPEDIESFNEIAAMLANAKDLDPEQTLQAEAKRQKKLLEEM